MESEPRSSRFSITGTRPETDLEDWMVELTTRTYSDPESVAAYEKQFEQNPFVFIDYSYPFALGPFLTRYFSYRHSPLDILGFAGCGTGRDMRYCIEQLSIPCIGFDISYTMLAAAHQNLASLPSHLYRLAQMNLVHMSFSSESLRGLICETALTHIPKSQAKDILDQAYRILKPGSVALFTFRQGDGHVYYTLDPVGLRFYTTFTDIEADDLLTGTGFKIVFRSNSPHPVPNRPKFMNRIVVKL